MAVILHTADVHLDRGFARAGMTSAIASARRQELRDAFKRFVELALQLEADAVTIGGDLYEHERFTLDTGHFLRQQLERLGRTPVLIAPGNHDPMTPDSLYRRIAWPDNVTIFSEGAFRPVPVAARLTVWGAAHTAPDTRENLLSGLQVSGPGRHLLLFHGSDMHAVPEGKPAHAPFLPEDIAATGADFALLGHYHGPRLYPGEAPVMGYPGSPEPLDFSEEGEHCVLRLDIDEQGVRPQLLPFGRVSYVTHALEVSAMLTSEEVQAGIRALAEPGVIARVVLEGQAEPELGLDMEALYNACAEAFTYLDIVDRTKPAYNFFEIAEESTTKGGFVRLLLRRLESAGEEEREVVEEALTLGLHAFERREVRAS